MESTGKAEEPDRPLIAAVREQLQEE